jgi:sulfur-oxidizing protein SoxA
MSRFLILVLLLVCFDVMAEKRNGYDYQSANIQALQDDDFSNPGMLWVDEGQELFDQPPGPDDKTCRSCHADVKGVARRYPAINPRLNKLVSLTEQIQICSETRQQVSIGFESREALALSAYIAFESKGLPMLPPDSPSLVSALDQGRHYYYSRKGQLNLSCAQCHEENSSRYLRGDLISEGRSNGYPIYRLEWESVGSLHRRFRSCDIGVRAEPFGLGSEAYTTLELYLRARSSGMPMTAPAVRR